LQVAGTFARRAGSLPGAAARVLKRG